MRCSYVPGILDIHKIPVVLYQPLTLEKYYPLLNRGLLQPPEVLFPPLLNALLYPKITSEQLFSHPFRSL